MSNMNTMTHSMTGNPAETGHSGRALQQTARAARTVAAIATLAVLVGIAGCNRNPAGVGVWDVSMNTPLGMMDATLTLNADGSGSMSTLELGEAPLEGAVYDGNNVSFDIEVDAQGQVVVLGFNGQVDGDAINGQFSSDFGSFAATGTRQ